MHPQAFCYMLKGFLQGKQNLNGTDTKFLQEQLHNVFEHVIDKQYEDGDGSQEVHDGKKSHVTIGGKNYPNERPRC